MSEHTFDTHTQTFIRNAAGKALVDSPALNPLSRQVLVPVARAALPSAINVPGPGPPEPRREGAESKPTPPIPAEADADGEVDASSAGEHSGPGDDEEDHIAAAHAPAGADPYASLGSAFGGYTADEPKPHTDNLLF